MDHPNCFREGLLDLPHRPSEALPAIGPAPPSRVELLSAPALLDGSVMSERPGPIDGQPPAKDEPAAAAGGIVGQSIHRAPRTASDVPAAVTEQSACTAQPSLLVGSHSRSSIMRFDRRMRSALARPRPCLVRPSIRRNAARHVDGALKCPEASSDRLHRRYPWVRVPTMPREPSEVLTPAHPLSRCWPCFVLGAKADDGCDDLAARVRDAEGGAVQRAQGGDRARISRGGAGAAAAPNRRRRCGHIATVRLTRAAGPMPLRAGWNGR